MSAAVRLCDAGKTVHVLEANSMIGGRTSSWNDEGMHIESGLHRFLGFYKALPDLLEHVGINLDEMLCWEDEIEIRVPDGPHAVLGLSPLHKPLKTIGGALGNNDLISPRDKLALAAMFTAGIEDYTTKPEELDSKTVLQYAKEHKVPRKAIDHMLRPLAEGIFFMPIEKYSAYNLIGLFAPFLPRIAKTRVGAFMGGMSEVMMQPMVDYIERRGGHVSTGVRVQRLEIRNDKIAGVWVSDLLYEADNIILAASLRGAQDIIGATFPKGHPDFADMLRLPTMPAVTFQIHLNRPSMEVDRTTFGPLTSMASFAEQSRTTFRSAPGRLSVILSPPEDFLSMPADEILEVVKADAARLGIELYDKTIDYRKVTLPHDFYSLAPGSEALRPRQGTSIGGLALAGDYTKQKYLATMEGAVVSGNLAAEVILAR
jgi:15-cis-phytoene desaturase